MSVSSTVNTVLHDLFMLAVSAAALYVKNPDHQEKASVLINLANGLLADITSQSAPTGSSSSQSS